MRIALIECPLHPLQIAWEDVYFPDAAFPISDFLYDEPNELRVWDFQTDNALTTQALVQELLSFQPVVLGISDHFSTNGLVLERLIKQMFPRALIFFAPDAIDPEDLLDKANQSAFRLRQRTRPVAGKMRFRSSWSETELLDTLNPEPDTDASVREQTAAMVQAFESRYALESWRRYLPLGAYTAVLETLELLEDCFPGSHPLWEQRQVRLLDVGAARWAYAPALYQFFALAHTQQPRQVFLTGIEIDPYRLDPEGYSCVDHALSYLDPVSSHIRYLNQDVLSYVPQQPYDVISLFKPYITRQEHLYGGLPLEFYRPEAMFGHLLHLLQADGVLLLSHRQADALTSEQDLLGALGALPLVKALFCSRLRQRLSGIVTLMSASGT
ncbi:MAG TPA: hypothetical protein V6D23_15620 [Candidatus Obscuribacterales bacterium]